VRITAVAALCLSIIGLCFAGESWAAIKYPTHVEAQALGPALEVLAREHGFQVLYRTEILNNVRAHALNGDLSTDEALQHLLSGTGLTYRYLGQSAITIIPVAERSNTSNSSSAGSEGPAKGGRPSSSPFRMAQTNRGPAAGNAAVLNRDPEPLGATLQEVVISAEKRSQKLIDVPMAVSVLSGNELNNDDVGSLADLASLVPGLSVDSGGAPGSRQIVIRGINTTNYATTTSSLVATYIDDMPVTASGAGYAEGIYGIDLNPYDVADIEVLKGPQGTVYGASAMGGIVKYTLKTPSLNGVSGNFGVDVGTIGNSNDPSWGIRGSANVPIPDEQLAFRVSAFYKLNAGWLDNVAPAVYQDNTIPGTGPGAKDANSSVEDGGLLSVLWKPTESFALDGNLIIQDVDADNIAEVNVDSATNAPTYGRYDFSSHFPEPFTLRTFVSFLHAAWDLGFASLNSSTGWVKVSSRQPRDLSSAFGAYCLPQGGLAGCPDYPFSTALALFVDTTSLSKFVEEIRLTSPSSEPIEWMAGGYYNREHSDYSETLPTFTPTFQALPLADNLLYDTAQVPYTETAAFGDASYKLTSKFEIGGGVRQSTYKEDYFGSPIFGDFNNGGALRSEPGPSVGVTNWMADAKYQPTTHATLYTRVATGYRPGDGCDSCGIPSLHIPGLVKPDRTTDYEAGVKGDFFNHRLQVDTDAFVIDWVDIQLNQLTSTGLSYAGNGGTARSQGFELTTQSRLLSGLQFNGTLAFTDAELTQDAPGAGGKNGDQLPGSPRWQGTAALDYAYTLNERSTLLLGGDYRYRSRVFNYFPSSGNPYPMSGYSVEDLYAGIEFGAVSVRLYAKNVLNTQAYTGLLYVDNPASPKFVPVQPRTLMLSVDTSF
jgi:outer membrane receptor protein involved in Fe transport